jgi:hypothetical protein
MRDAIRKQLTTFKNVNMNMVKYKTLNTISVYHTARTLKDRRSAVRMMIGLIKVSKNAELKRIMINLVIEDRKPSIKAYLARINKETGYKISNWF